MSGLRYHTASPDGIVLVRSSAGTVTYELTDSRDTAVTSVDASSLAVARRYLDPYGSSRGKAPASWPDQHGYLNRAADHSTGLSLLGARQYDPATGRFLSVDPLLAGGDPQQMNGYVYADDNPVTESDPTGLSATCGYGCPPSPSPAATSTATTGDSPGGTGSSAICYYCHVLAYYNADFVRPAATHKIKSPAPAAAPGGCTMGGKAGFEPGCHAPVSSSHGGGFSLWNFVKAAAGFVYHASGAADVVGCISHPSVGGCLLAAASVALTVMTAGDGMLARAAIEGGVGLAMRGVALRTATRVGEMLGEVLDATRVGRAVRAAAADMGDVLNPVLGYREVGAPTELSLGNSFSPRVVNIPNLAPIRLLGDHPIEAAIEGAKKGMEWLDWSPIQVQDQVPLPVEFLAKRYGLR